MNEEFLICAICGFQFKQLQTHIKHKHNMTAKEYKEKFGEQKLVIVTPEIIQKHKDTKKNGGTKLEIRFCKCGCGLSKEVPINSDWQYKSGHNGTGKKRSEKTKQLISIGNKGKVKPKGANNFKWIKREERTCKCGCGQTFECRITSNKQCINREHFKKTKGGSQTSK